MWNLSIIFKKRQTVVINHYSKALGGSHGRCTHGRLAGVVVGSGTEICASIITLHPVLSLQILQQGWLFTQNAWKFVFQGLTDSCLASSPIDNSLESHHAQDSGKCDFSRSSISSLQRFHFPPSSIWHVPWEERKWQTFPACTAR